MKKGRNGFINNLRYICLTSVIAFGFITIVATGGGGGGGGGSSSQEDTSAGTTIFPSDEVIIFDSNNVATITDDNGYEYDVCEKEVIAVFTDDATTDNYDDFVERSAGAVFHRPRALLYIVLTGSSY